MSDHGASVFGQSQAQMISNVCSNILIFCGLIIAGTFTLLASDAVPRNNWAFLFSVASTFTLGFCAGLVALVAIMKAHNLARRAERLQAGLDTDAAKIEAARRLSVRLSVASFYVTMTAAISAFVTVCFFLPQLLSSLGDHSKVQISKVDGGVALELSGDPIPSVKILKNGADCNGVIAFKDAEVTISKVCN
jgi:hypothetical protein